MMDVSGNIPARRKLVWSFVLASASLLSLCGVAFSLYFYQLLQRDFVDAIATRSRFIGQNAISFLTAKEPHPTGEVLAPLMGDRHVIAACVFDAQGKIVARYVRAEDSANVVFPNVQLDGPWFNRDNFEIFQLVASRNEIIGRVYIKTDLEEFNARWWQFVGILGMILGTGSLLVLGGVIYLRRTMPIASTPASQPTNSAVAMAMAPAVVFAPQPVPVEPAPSPVSPVPRTSQQPAAPGLSLSPISPAQSVTPAASLDKAIDETDSAPIVATFNWMMAQIQQRDADLVKSREAIEQRVGERTRELAQGNEILRKEIQERQKVEEALLNSQQKLVLHVKQTPLGVIDWNLDFEAVNWNPAAEKIFGFTEAQAIGRHACDLVFPEISHEKVGKTWRDLLEQKGGQHNILENRTRDGRSLICEWFHTPLVGLDGRVVGVTSLVQDVTLRQRAAETLRQSEERFSKAFRSSPLAMTICSLDIGRFLDVNESFLKMFDLSCDEVIGHTEYELNLWVTPDERKQLADRLKRDRHFRDVICQLRTKTGQIRSAIVSGELIDIGSEPCMLTITQDITEKLSLEEQLRQSQKMEAVGQLAAGVAHDFNNILTIIHGHTALLQRALPADTPATESLKQIGGAAMRAANLVRQLLAFSRRQVMQPKPLNLNEVVQNLTKLLNRVLREDINLDFNCAPSLPTVRADAGMMEQVLLNLAVNARDAMPNGGRLTISSNQVVVDDVFLQQHPEARPGSFVCLSVTDTGTGIPPEIRHRIFEPFFTTKGVGQGTGLGLAMVYGILKQHEGWIEVESEIGEGTTFHLYLPAAPETFGPETQNNANENEAVRGGKETILVVEDEPALRELVHNMLQQLGYNVLAAGNGPEAQKVWKQNQGQVDLLLTDIVMPHGLSGRQLAEDLRNTRPDLKIIFTSGYSIDIISKNLASEKGFNFLPKPFHPLVLARAVRDCLDGKRVGSELVAPHERN